MKHLDYKKIKIKNYYFRHKNHLSDYYKNIFEKADLYQIFENSLNIQSINLMILLQNDFSRLKCTI